MRVIEIQGTGGPEMLRVAERPDPVPGPGEVVVDVHAASVNAADWKVRRGSAILNPEFPHVPGRDFSGVVGAAGAVSRDRRRGFRRLPPRHRGRLCRKDPDRRRVRHAKARRL